MREYNYSIRYSDLLTQELAALLTQSHELKGAQGSFFAAKEDALTQLVELAKLQSTGLGTGRG